MRTQGSNKYTKTNNPKISKQISQNQQNDDRN